MNKFGWSEVKQYWEARSSYWETANHGDDPDALRCVVNSTEPLWYGKYRAWFEKVAYQALCDRMPLPRPGARALDIGCGAGRWARFLSERGYQTVGIDLQPALVQAARRRYPHIDFLHTSLQEYSPKEPFDFISSVQVLLCNPFEEQQKLISRIRELLIDGGYVIMLEGIIEDGRPEVFRRPIGNWIEVVEKLGFRNIAINRYQYDLVSNALRAVLKEVRQRASIPRRQRPSRNELLSPVEMARIPKPKRDLRSIAKRSLVGIEAPVEYILTRRNVALPSYYCGFLFQAI